MLNQATGYAATALGFLAAAGGKPLLVKEIAEGTDIPNAYLAKIVNSLARKGILVTQRGIGGGVTLNHPPMEISLYDLAVALDDPSIRMTCMLGVAACSDERSCPAHRFWADCRTRYIDYLKKMTISDIAAFDLRRRTKGARVDGSGNDPRTINLLKR